MNKKKAAPTPAGRSDLSRSPKMIRIIVAHLMIASGVLTCGASEEAFVREVPRSHMMSDAPTDETKLNDLMFLVLDHAVASIEDTGGPLIPFSITEDASGEKKLTRYATERLEEGEAQAKKEIEEAKANIIRYAIAWDGFVTIEGKKWDALLVEAGDKVDAAGVLLCQRYQKKGFLRKGVEPVGNPVLLERPPSRIK